MTRRTLCFVAGVTAAAGCFLYKAAKCLRKKTTSQNEPDAEELTPAHQKVLRDQNTIRVVHQRGNPHHEQETELMKSTFFDMETQFPGFLSNVILYNVDIRPLVKAAQHPFAVFLFHSQSDGFHDVYRAAASCCREPLTPITVANQGLSHARIPLHCIEAFEHETQLGGLPDKSVKFLALELCHCCDAIQEFLHRPTVHAWMDRVLTDDAVIVFPFSSRFWGWKAIETAFQHQAPSTGLRLDPQRTTAASTSNKQRSSVIRQVKEDVMVLASEDQEQEPELAATILDVMALGVTKYLGPSYEDQEAQFEIKRDLSEYFTLYCRTGVVQDILQFLQRTILPAVLETMYDTMPTSVDTEYWPYSQNAVLNCLKDFCIMAIISSYLMDHMKSRRTLTFTSHSVFPHRPRLVLPYDPRAFHFDLSSLDLPSSLRTLHGQPFEKQLSCGGTQREMVYLRRAPATPSITFDSLGQWACFERTAEADRVALPGFMLRFNA